MVDNVNLGDVYMQLRLRLDNLDSDVRKGLGQIKQQSAEGARSLGELKGAFRDVTEGARALGAIIPALSFAGLIEGVHRSVEALSQLADTAETLDTSVEQLQKYQRLFAEAGLSAEDTARALTTFSRAQADAAKGQGEMYAFFKENGIATDNLTTGLEQFATALSKVAQPQRQLQLAFEAFGRNSGPQMVNTLRQGGEALTRALTGMGDFATATQQEAEEARRLNAEFTQLRISLERFSQTAIVDAAREWDNFWSAANGRSQTFAPTAGTDPIKQQMLELTNRRNDLRRQLEQPEVDVDPTTQTATIIRTEQQTQAIRDQINALNGQIKALLAGADAKRAFDTAGPGPGGQSAISGGASRQTGTDLPTSFIKAEEAVQRQNLAMRDQIAVVGQDSAAQAALAVRLHLLATLQDQYGNELEKAGDKATLFRSRIDAVAKAAGDMTQKLATAKLTSDIAFEGGLLGLTDEDIRIATRLRDIYNNDIPKALASSQAAAMRLHDEIKAGVDATASLGSGLLSDIRSGKSLKDIFLDRAFKLGDQIFDAQFKAMLTNAASTPGGASLFGGLGKLLLPQSSASAVSAAGLAANQTVGAMTVGSMTVGSVSGLTGGLGAGGVPLAGGGAPGIFSPNDVGSPSAAVRFAAPTIANPTPVQVVSVGPTAITPTVSPPVNMPSLPGFNTSALSMGPFSGWPSSAASVPPPNVPGSAIAAAQSFSAITGMPTSQALALQSIETGGSFNTNDVNRFGYGGLFGLQSRNYGSSVFDSSAAAGIAGRDINALRTQYFNKYGVMPDGGDTYGMHNQGFAGWDALKNAPPGTSAVDALSGATYNGRPLMSSATALAHIQNNMLPNMRSAGFTGSNIPADQFTGLMKSDFTRRAGQYSAFDQPGMNMANTGQLNSVTSQTLTQLSSTTSQLTGEFSGVSTGLAGMSTGLEGATSGLGNFSQGLGSALQGFGGGGGGGFGGGFFGNIASSGGFDGGEFLRGGVIGSGSGTKFRAPRGLFYGAPHFRRGGSISPDTVPIFAHEGEEVLTAGDPRNIRNSGRRSRAMAAGGGPNIHMTVMAQDAPSFNRSRGQVARSLTFAAKVAQRHT